MGALTTVTDVHFIDRTTHVPVKVTGVHEQDMLEHAVLPAERAVALLLPPAQRPEMVALAAARHEERTIVPRSELPPCFAGPCRANGSSAPCASSPSCFACTGAGEGKEAAAVEEALGQQAVSCKHPVAEHAVTPLDTISGADARLVLDAPFYYHWPSGDSAFSECVYSARQTVCAGLMLPAAVSMTNIVCFAAIVWLALEGDLIWQMTIDSDSSSDSTGQKTRH